MSVLLEVDGLSIAFGGIRAVDGVSFKVEQGEILSIIGPNGAGKTTVFNLISRIYPPGGGRVRFEGRDLTDLPAWRIASLGIARTFQNIELFEQASVLQNLLLGCHSRRHAPIWAEILHLPAIRRIEQANREAAETVIEFLKLQRHRSSLVGSLPYGARKVVELGRALCSEPRLLLLDEPSSGLNVEETDDIAYWLQDIRERFGATIVMIEHDMRLVGRVSDKVVALNDGRVLASGDFETVRNHPEVALAYLGAEA
jgi:branched-chain amino acid transport system ATP-binding protein